MPKVRQYNTPASERALQFCGPLAIHPMGARYSGTFPTSQSTKEISYCCLQIFHKVGRGRSCSSNHPEEYKNFFIGKHYLPIRYSSTDHHRQWTTVKRWQNFTILFQPTYHYESLFNLLPADQWSSGVGQQEHLEFFEKTVGWSQGIIGRRIAEYTMGYPNNSTLGDNGYNL